MTVARVIGRAGVAVAFSIAAAIAAGCGGGDCGSHADCAADEVCLFGDAPRCAPRCTPDNGACPSDLVCEECATASCPLCQDCVAACVLPE